MAINSINTNDGSFVALQNMAATSTSLRETQDRISTGKKIANAKDNGAIWAISQNLRGASQSINAVKQSLDRAQSTADVAITAATNVSDLLVQMKEKALAATDAALDTQSRLALNDDFKVLRDTVKKTVDNADFNGTNMIKTAGTSMSALANVTGTNVITIQAQSMALGSANLTGLSTTSSFNTAATAQTILGSVNTAINKVNRSLATMGAQYKAVALHNTFMAKLQDNLDSGVGNLVDADLGRGMSALCRT